MAHPRTIGVIGLGSIGLRHAKILVNVLPTSTLGWDPDAARCVEAAKAGVAIYGHTELMSRADAVVIATPTSLHYHQLGDALLAHKPVFVEKPIADTGNVGLLRDHINQGLVMVGYNLRFHSCVKKAKEWLDAGLIGEPLWANFMCAQYNDKYKDSVILNWSHEIDLALYLLGPAKVMACVASPGEVLADIILRHEGHLGLRQTAIHLDYITKPERRGFTITGAKGSLHVDLVERFAWIDAADFNHHDFTGEDSYDENYVEEMQAFLDRIDGKETIGCAGSEGLQVLELCLEARRLAGLA